MVESAVCRRRIEIGIRSGNVALPFTGRMPRRLPSALALALFVPRSPSVAPRPSTVSSVALPAPVPEVRPGRRPALPRRAASRTACCRPRATVYDDHPGVVGLDSRLLEELRAATADASAQGIGIVSTGAGGRRRTSRRCTRRQSPSTARSRGAVARPGTSVHESGAAVDLGAEQCRRLAGAARRRLGLCQVYDNEPWHFVELDPDAVEQGCPPPYDDPSDDPRLQM